MEITIKKTTEKKVKIELPLYRASKNFAYKVYSEENCIAICCHPGMMSIHQVNSSLAWTLDNVKDCTREEFEEMYQKVSSEIAKFL